MVDADTVKVLATIATAIAGLIGSWAVVRKTTDQNEKRIALNERRIEELESTSGDHRGKIGTLFDRTDRINDAVNRVEGKVENGLKSIGDRIDNLMIRMKS